MPPAIILVCQKPQDEALLALPAAMTLDLKSDADSWLSLPPKYMDGIQKTLIFQYHLDRLWSSEFLEYYLSMRQLEVAGIDFTLDAVGHRPPRVGFDLLGWMTACACGRTAF